MELIFILFLALSINADKSPDFDRNFSQLLNSRGIAFEQHTVETEDGYFLTLFRAPGLLSEPASIQPKPVVVLNHGLCDQSDTWIYNDPENSIGTILPYLGYDVWFVNNRGVHWSQGHKSEKPNFWNKKYWNFTFDEMAKYDLVGNINKIIEVTGQQSVTIIGHSQGNAQAFAALSDPEIAPKIESKVKMLIALSAPLYLKNVHSKFWNICAKWNCQQLFIDISVYGIFNGFEDITPIIAPICNIIEPIC